MSQLEIWSTETIRADSIYRGLKYSVSDINRDFKIKLNQKATKNKKSRSILLGVSGLIKEIGIEITNKHIEKAYSKGKDIYTFKLRRGIVIRLYNK